jgi:hypothetical protein
MKLPDDDKPEQPPGQRPCMDDYEYNTWEFWNNRTMAKDYAKSPCEDCTVDYSREMAKMGLCDGTPSVVIRSRHLGTSSGEKLSVSNTETSPVKAARVHAHKAAWTPERRERMSRLMRERNLDPAWQNRVQGGKCAELRCKSPVHSKGLCQKHYAKSLRDTRKEHDERM